MKEVHILTINVWALFAIDLDRYEVLVEQLRNSLVVEGFVGHHMAPMACRVPNADEEKTVRAFCKFKRIWRP